MCTYKFLTTLYGYYQNSFNYTYTIFYCYYVIVRHKMLCFVVSGEAPIIPTLISHTVGLEYIYNDTNYDG